MTTVPIPLSEASILVVDDVPDNLRLLAKILESQNYTVLKSLNGRMALRAAARKPPDLILLDINMPDLNGYEICQQLRAAEQTASIPVIFISALDQITDKIRAFELGGQDYITKPFQELEVLARVKSQLIIQQQKQLLLYQNQQLQQEIQIRHQAEAEVRRLNVNLERQVKARTLELQQALSFELALKHISDQVRDSLDQNQILQIAVTTLAQTLELHCCDAALYNSDHSTSTIHHEWVKPGCQTVQGQIIHIGDLPEVYNQLQERQSFAFCQTQPTPIRNHSAILACPIFDDQVNQTGIVGDLWLFRDTYSSFSEMEIHLVQQVANQCAIALRQAHLYEAAQAQVKELERLNQLKDDFLNTISHELRTPIASMKMVINLLISLTERGHNLLDDLSRVSSNSKAAQYLGVLQQECDRELSLVEDLLNLQHIEAGTYMGQATLINLQDLVPYLVEPFAIRTQHQNQTLQVSIPTDLPPLYCDSIALNRILTELLSNACKYTPPGGSITISASLASESPATSAHSSAHSIHLAIANTGIEIAPEEQSRIFDKFYRIPNNDPWKHGGTGLGLALVKKLVDQMGGTIAVASANHQTCFVVQFKVS